ncbi:MAG: dUTP diphosphatase, partial [Mesorhizobium sp.]
MRTAVYPSSVIGPTVGFVRLPHGEGLPLPTYESAGAAGM